MGLAARWQTSGSDRIRHEVAKALDRKWLPPLRRQDYNMRLFVERQLALQYRTHWDDELFVALLLICLLLHHLDGVACDVGCAIKCASELRWPV